MIFPFSNFPLPNVDSYLSPEFMPVCTYSIIHSFIRHLFDKTWQKKKATQNSWLMEITYTLEIGTL